jgi:hypothetical protein
MNATREFIAVVVATVKMIIAMLARFMATDRAFAKARRMK